MNQSDTWQPSKYDLRSIRSSPEAMAEPFIFAEFIARELMSDPTQPSVWPAMLPTVLFFGGLGSAAMLTQLMG